MQRAGYYYCSICSRIAQCNRTLTTLASVMPPSTLQGHNQSCGAILAISCGDRTGNSRWNCLGMRQSCPGADFKRYKTCSVTQLMSVFLQVASSSHSSVGTGSPASAAANRPPQTTHTEHPMPELSNSVITPSSRKFLKMII